MKKPSKRAFVKLMDQLGDAGYSLALIVDHQLGEGGFPSPAEYKEARKAVAKTYNLLTKASVEWPDKETIEKWTSE